jgi:hypothetical protein
MDNHGALCVWMMLARNQRTALVFEFVREKLIYQLDDRCVAYDLALLALSGFFFSRFTAVILSTVSN